MFVNKIILARDRNETFFIRSVYVQKQSVYFKMFDVVTFTNMKTSN